MTEAARQLTRTLERIASALEKLAAQNEVTAPSETVNIEEAAKLLKTTPRALYQRRHSGRMPTPITKRPLVWRKSDLLRSGK